MPRREARALDRQRVSDWINSSMAARSGTRQVPTDTGVLRTFDSTESWNPQTVWPSTPDPYDSISFQTTNSADLITSDDPWYLEAVVQLVLQKLPQSICALKPEVDREEVYVMLQHCSDTRLPLEQFALAVNILAVLPRDGEWVREWMESRSARLPVRWEDDCMPDGDLIPSENGVYLPSYFRPDAETPPPPPELCVLGVLAIANDLLLGIRHPMGKDYRRHSPGHWAILVSRGRFGAGQVQAARKVIWRQVQKMRESQVWGKLHVRMDQIDRRAHRIENEEWEQEEENEEFQGIFEGLEGVRLREEGGLFGGSDLDDEEESGGLAVNAGAGTEDTKSMAFSDWLEKIPHGYTG
ncbi:MAG: hypothetical protein Q9191_000200 [Dirinaria sp. TL-2023a]